MSWHDGRKADEQLECGREAARCCARGACLARRRCVIAVRERRIPARARALPYRILGSNVGSHTMYGSDASVNVCHTRRPLLCVTIPVRLGLPRAGAARAPGPAADRGANPRGMRGTRGRVVGRRGQNAPYTRPPPRARPLSLSRLRSINISLLSIDRRTPRVSGLAHAPRIKKDVPAREQRWPVPNRCTTGGEHNSG